MHIMYKVSISYSYSLTISRWRKIEVNCMYLLYEKDVQKIPQFFSFFCLQCTKHRWWGIPGSSPLALAAANTSGPDNLNHDIVIKRETPVLLHDG